MILRTTFNLNYNNIASIWSRLLALLFYQGCIYRSLFVIFDYNFQRLWWKNFWRNFCSQWFFRWLIFEVKTRNFHGIIIECLDLIYCDILCYFWSRRFTNLEARWIIFLLNASKINIRRQKVVSLTSIDLCTMRGAGGSQFIFYLRHINYSGRCPWTLRVIKGIENYISVILKMICLFTYHLRILWSKSTFMIFIRWSLILKSLIPNILLNTKSILHFGIIRTSLLSNFTTIHFFQYKRLLAIICEAITSLLLFDLWWKFSMR